MYASAQECNCRKSLDGITVFLKRNYAGYIDKIGVHNQEKYAAHTRKYSTLAETVQTIVQCVSLIDEWLTFFKDHHLNITYDPARLPYAIKERKSQYERIELLPAQLSELFARKRRNDIEGIYHTKDTSYTVAVVKSSSTTRDYAGVVLTSKTKSWTAGQVKFELKKTPDGLYKVIWYDSMHNATFDKLDFSRANPLLTNGWLKENPVEPDSTEQQATATQPFKEDLARKLLFHYQKLDSSSAYLRIRSFNVNYLPKIDSILKAHWQDLLEVPNLVIDVRGNGGGGDISYRSLKQLIYTQPVKIIGADFLSTSENIANYVSMIKAAELPANEERMYIQQVERAKLAVETYFNFSADRIDTLSEVLPNPRRVAIIIDHGCASATEQFLLEAKQSRKVTIYGQPSMGALDYANVCSKFYPAISSTLDYPTTRSRRIDKKQGVDNAGIQPDVPLAFQEADWLQYVLSDLKAR